MGIELSKLYRKKGRHIGLIDRMNKVVHVYAEMGLDWSKVIEAGYVKKQTLTRWLNIEAFREEVGRVQGYGMALAESVLYELLMQGPPMVRLEAARVLLSAGVPEKYNPKVVAEATRAKGNAFLEYVKVALREETGNGKTVVEGGSSESKRIGYSLDPRDRELRSWIPEDVLKSATEEPKPSPLMEDYKKLGFGAKVEEEPVPSLLDEGEEVVEDV